MRYFPEAVGHAARTETVSGQVNSNEREEKDATEEEITFGLRSLFEICSLNILENC